MYSDFRVTRCVMKQTTRYDTVALRPYTTHYDRSIEQLLAESTENGNNVNAQTLSSAASQFLQPSAVAKGVADIANGFNEQRFSFMIEVVDDRGGLSVGNRYILTGYTDHVGVAQNMGRQAIDPNMKLFINNVFMMRDTQINTPNGIQTRSNIVDNMHVLIDPNHNDFYNKKYDYFSQRPEDVFATIGYNNDPMMSEARANGIDQRSMISTPRASSRRNDSRPNYLAETIKSFKNASAEEETSQDDDYTDGSNVWDMSRNYQRQTISGNRLMNVLSTKADYMTLGFVTYADLCNILPNLDQKNDVVMMGAAQQQREYQPGQGESWQSTSFEAIAATIFNQVTPSIMTDCLLTRIHFMATNDTIGAQHEIIPLAFNGFSENIDLTPFIQHFMARLQREVLDDISKGSQVLYQVECIIDLTYDSTFKISLDGEPMVMFTAPSFCDSLYAPVLSSDSNDINNMASDIETMLYNVSGDLRRMHNQQQGPVGGQQSPIITPGQQPMQQGMGPGSSGFDPLAMGAGNDDSL